MFARFLPSLSAAFGLFFAGCFATSVNPLSTPATSTVDPRLEGVFVAHRDPQDDSLNVSHFQYRREKSLSGGSGRTTPWLEIVDIEHSKNDSLRGRAYRALTTHLGEHDYLSVSEVGSVLADAPRTVGEKGKPGEYYLFRYEIGVLGELRLWGADTAALQKAVEAGKLHGQVTHRRPIAKTFDLDSVLLTDSTEHLATFVAHGDPATLFGGKPIVLYRLTR